jgi:hypothetical protein
MAVAAYTYDKLPSAEQQVLPDKDILWQPWNGQNLKQSPVKPRSSHSKAIEPTSA